MEEEPLNLRSINNQFPVLLHTNIRVSRVSRSELVWTESSWRFSGINKQFITLLLHFLWTDDSGRSYIRPFFALIYHLDEKLHPKPHFLKILLHSWCNYVLRSFCHNQQVQAACDMHFCQELPGRRGQGWSQQRLGLAQQRWPVLCRHLRLLGLAVGGEGGGGVRHRLRTKMRGENPRSLSHRQRDSLWGEQQCSFRDSSDPYNEVKEAAVVKLGIGRLPVNEIEEGSRVNWSSLAIGSKESFLCKTSCKWSFPGKVRKY